MTRVLALASQSKIGCITQRRFAKAGTKTHSQRGAALDRNGLSVSTETACRFEPKSPVGNSEICNNEKDHITQDGEAASSPETEGVEDLATILEGMVGEIQRHVILGPHHPEAVALWVLHAHGIAACQYSPRLNLRSPEAECGKTTLLEIIQGFCEVRGSQIESSTTPAAYFRYVHQASTEGGLPPVMLLDEIDNFLDVNRTDAYSILNSGHKLAGAWVNRCDITSEGVYRANRYCTWAPCVRRCRSFGQLPGRIS